MLQQITQQGAFTADIAALLNANFAAIVGPGTTYFVNPVRGADNNDGSLQNPLRTLRAAYDKCVAGYGDTVAVISDGSTTGSVRLGATFTWAKNNTHLVGISSGVNLSNRSRIAPTAAVTAFTPFFTISASGCRFQNIQWFHGFDTGTTSQICLNVTGGRNLFVDCHIAGLGDDASAQSAGSRSLKISTTGENMFVRCTIGLDSVTRTVANASVEFASGAPRNKFIDCDFVFMTSADTPLGVIVSATAGSDRWQLFDRCRFINNVKSSSTAMAALSTLAAAMGGLHLYTYCTLVGITEYGTDATSRGQIYVDGGTVTAATTGIGVNPT